MRTRAVKDLLWLSMLLLSVMLATRPAMARQDRQTSVPQPPGSEPAAAAAESANSNAATVYRRAFAKYHEISRRINDQQWMSVYDFEGDPSRGPSLEARETLKKLQPAITLTTHAARREHSAFGVDYASADATLQHFGDARSLVRLLGYDYLQRISDDDAHGAIEELATMYRMAGHMAEEPTILGPLVGSAILSFADSRLNVALDHAIIGPPEAGTLLRELAKFKGDDPLGFRAALAKEQGVMTDSMSRRFSGEEGVERFRAAYREWFADDPEAAAALEALTPERLATMLSGFAEAAGAMSAAFNDPDGPRGDAAMARIQARIEREDFGPLAHYFNALYGTQLRDGQRRAQRTLDDERKVLGDIAEGRLDPMALANAAVWYVRAGMQWEQIDPDKRKLIDAYAAKHDAPADANLTAIFNRHDVQTLLETLRTAANLRRCDWDYASGGWPYVFRPYHAGLLGCGRILVGDAARLLHEQRYEDATIRMAVAYRMTGQIATDGVIAGSLSAHRIFADVDALAAAAIDSRMLNTDQIVLLSDQVATISRSDPFHYQPAISALRHNLDYPVQYMVQGLPKDARRPKQEQEERAAKILDGLDADRVLAINIVYDYWEKSFYQHRESNLALQSAGLETIFDVKAIGDAADFAPALTEWARTGQVEQMRTAAFPKITTPPLEQRVKDSLTDYRRCVLRFDRLRPK